MFWGANIKVSEEYELKKHEGKVLTIANACLTSNSDDNKYNLQISNNGNAYQLCVLQKNKNESANLNNTLVIERGMKLGLKGTGKGEVSLTGFFENELNEEILGGDPEKKSHEKVH